MAPPLQWCVRWGCLILVCAAVLLHVVSLSAPTWVKVRLRPGGYHVVLAMLAQEGADVSTNSTPPDGVAGAYVTVGLWHWCAQVDSQKGSVELCRLLQLGDLPDWWKGSQALAVVGLLMGLLACTCGALEVYYSRRGVKFSGLAVLCAISCFVTALALALSTGLYIARYINNSFALMHLPHLSSAGTIAIFPPIVHWGFGLGATAGTLMGASGVVLLAFVTRTYPAYHRTANVVV